jgi:uncharacterized membrane protein
MDASWPPTPAAESLPVVADRSDFVAVLYDGRSDAEKALAAVVRLGHDGGVTLRDAAIVVKDPAGRIQLHQTGGLAVGEGVVAGGTVGLLAGLLFGIPVGAALAGMLAGGGWGARDTGIPDVRLRTLGRELDATHAVLCALVAEGEAARVRVEVEPYGGEVLDTEGSGTEP